jgi:hypothetical protein
MKDGICPLCKSNEVYMTENKNNLYTSGSIGLHFEAGMDMHTDINYYFDTYVCINCGYTAMFAKATWSRIDGLPLEGKQGLSFLKKADGWKKAG